MWITFYKNKLTLEEYWRIGWDKKIVRKNRNPVENQSIAEKWMKARILHNFR